MGKQAFHTILVRLEIGPTLLDVDLQFLSKLKLQIPFKAVIPCLGIHPNVKMNICENMCA